MSGLQVPQQVLLVLTSLVSDPDLCSLCAMVQELLISLRAALSCLAGTLSLALSTPGWLNLQPVLHIFVSSLVCGCVLWMDLRRKLQSCLQSYVRLVSSIDPGPDSLSCLFWGCWWNLLPGLLLSHSVHLRWDCTRVGEDTDSAVVTLDSGLIPPCRAGLLLLLPSSTSFLALGKVLSIRKTSFSEQHFFFVTRQNFFIFAFVLKSQRDLFLILPFLHTGSAKRMNFKLNQLASLHV